MWPARALDTLFFPALHVPADIEAGLKAGTVLFNFGWRSAKTVAFDEAEDRGGVPLAVAVHFWSDFVLIMARWVFYGDRRATRYRTGQKAPEEDQGARPHVGAGGIMERGAAQPRSHTVSTQAAKEEAMVKTVEPGDLHEGTGKRESWKALYMAAGVAALVAAILFRRWLGAELSLLRDVGVFRVPARQPVTPADWFALLEANGLAGVILLNGLDLINYALVGLMILGLHAALKHLDKTAMTLAAVLALAGVAIYFSSNQAFALLSLSRQYRAAATEGQRALLLSAGQTLLAMNDHAVFGTGVFWGFTLVTVSCLIISMVMLRSRAFSRTTAWMGIIANALGLGYFFTLAFIPPLTFIPLSASAPLLMVWYILTGLGLLKLCRPAAVSHN